MDAGAQKNFRFSIRLTCGADSHGPDECGCRIYRSNVWATDQRTAVEMAEQEAAEMGGERIGTVREEAV